MCLHELGVEKEPQKRAAAEALVALCLDPELLPAVDQDHVLRRLATTATATRHPEALRAALDVLWRLRQDEYWTEDVRLSLTEWLVLT